jgi:small subunit ribosomal protein S18
MSQAARPPHADRPPYGDRPYRERSDRGDRDGDRSERGYGRGDRPFDRDRDRDGPPERSVKARLRAKARKKARKLRKKTFRGPKVSRLTTDKGLVIDYKDPRVLRMFLTETGKVLPRRISGNTARQQREVVEAVKRARHLALLPYGESPQ